MAAANLPNTSRLLVSLRVRHRVAKRPFAPLPRACKINYQPGNKDYDRILDLALEILARQQNVKKAGNCQQRRQRVEPHAKRPWQIGLAMTKHHHAHSLNDEL